METRWVSELHVYSGHNHAFIGTMNEEATKDALKQTDYRELVMIKARLEQQPGSTIVANIVEEPNRTVLLIDGSPLIAFLRIAD